MKLAHVWITAATTLTILGCATETVSSKDIRTGGIAATLLVEAGSESSALVKATLRVGGDESNTYVELEGGDALRVEAGSESTPLGRKEQGVYQANTSQGGEGTQYRVVFDRTGDDEDARDSVGTLPKPFGITAVPTNSPSRKADDIVVKWDNSGTSDAMDISVEGDCIFDWDETNISDSGEYTIKKDELDSTGGDKAEECTLTVTVTRRRSGTTDPKLDNESSFVLQQRRTATFVSKP